ncbi:MAG TPA: peptide ABC transporter substrate-binding protein [Anaerolineae bacterium]|nr:peptide ABC transporter substrate-binding protein [Anaerolineae bacterium]
MSARKWCLTLVLALALIASACGPAATPTPTEPPAAPATQPPAPPTEPPPTPTEPPARKVATFIWTQEFDTLNPYYTNMWFSTITHQFWNCWPWIFDDQNNLVPVLVEELPSTENGGISADGKTLTMKLRDDITWSDGTPITADDFVFTYEMVINPKNIVASTDPYDKMESVTAPDPQTVVVTFKDAYAPWAGSLWHGILPKHVLEPVLEKDGTLDNAEWNRNPTVGCGPYNFAEWESGSFARFVARDAYWAGRPKIDEIFIRFVPDDASQVAALKAGDGDLGTFIAYSDVPDLEAAGVAMYKAFSGYNEGIYFNLSSEKGHPALQDQRVRQAIALATDRESLNKDLLLGLTQPAATDWDNTPYIDPSIDPWPYDPEQAKQLLDEAGWVDSNGDGVRDKDGVELVLKYGTTTREIRMDTQAVLQQQLAEVGIKVELLNFESDIYFGGYADGGPAATGQLDIFEYSNSPQFPDPDTAEWLCSEIPTDEYPDGTNWSLYCDEELDALFQKQATQVDFAERQATFYQITKMIFDQVYWLGLWQDPDIWAVNSRLKNVKFSGTTPFFNIIEWDIE